MLNYIWASLIAIGIFTAIGTDVYREQNNFYRNEVEFSADIKILNYIRGEENFSGEILADKNYYNSFYNTNESGIIKNKIVVSKISENNLSIVLPIDKSSPKFWQEIAQGGKNKNELTGKIKSIKIDSSKTFAKISFVIEKISFLKTRAVTDAAFNYASIAVELAIGLIGIMALWLGIMAIADKTGVLLTVAKLLTPITKKIFPDVPPDHPAIGAMIMNISANMLGLNNAATPLGLKAMEELNKLNTKVGTATNAMCTFLVINTAGLTLIPATVIAIRASMGSADPGIIIGTSIFGAGCATVFGILAVKILERLKIFNKDAAE